ncbi:S1 family peptidase [Tautonia marina]|uniref:S1 family peptidase n=1 Tax=Tautonia marina TaxID=2653855 RepID=UPI0012610451|nr:serine protease [Tautonia marina]
MGIVETRRGLLLGLVASLLVGSLDLAVTQSATAQGGERRIAARSITPEDLPGPLDDVIFRPTVMVRKGNSRGSGTIIASTKGRSLILTAAHVIDGPGRAAIELHRFNLGIEGRKLGGSWPKVIPAKILAADLDADVAVLMVEGLARLPHVARLDESLAEPLPDGFPVTSVGIDHASDLNSWDSRIRGTALLSRNLADEGGSAFTSPSGNQGQTPSRDPRLFVITEHPPIQGRSGGGLYASDGRLLGVCVGRIEVKSTRGEERAIGLFASGQSIQRVLEQLDEAQSPSN